MDARLRATGSSLVLASEIDEFQMALPGVHGSLNRTAAGDRPCRVSVRTNGAVQTATLALGFPMQGEVDVADDSLVVALVLGMGDAGRWDGFDLRPGQAFVYPPGSFHQAIDSTGMSVGMIVANVDAVHEAADDLGRPLGALQRTVLEGGRADRLVEAHRSADDEDELLRALVASIAPSPEALDRGRAATSRHIVRTVLAHLDETGEWMPSMLSLCRASGASERRLQLAFHDVYGVTPTTFIRRRALSAARSRLVAGTPHDDAVHAVAHRFGFHHGGRFASYYRAAYGERPSDTLAAP